MDTVVVFTRKTLEVMFEQGGCGDWVASREQLGKCTYLITTANAHAKEGSEHPSQIHAHAFLIGKVSGIKEAPENPGRRIIQFNEYAEIDIPEAWGGQRNPIRYANFSEFGIDPNELQWKPFPKDREKVPDTTPELTIEDAKRGLAKKLGVTPNCIDITIRA